MAAVSSPSTSNTAQAQVYASHLQNSLLPELEATRHSLAQVEFDISEYEALRGKLVDLGKEQGKSIETTSELGAGVWVHTKIPDTSAITLDLGLDLHLDMPVADAQEYTKKKVEVLKKKRDVLSQKEEHLVWQIGQFHGAMAQQSNATPTASQ
ncbi:hypothetical protein IAT38_002117 [Cryptococcus sp. DSM 104549]